MEGYRLVTCFHDDFLCSNVVRKALDSPYVAQKSFFTVRIFAFWGKQSFAAIGDHSLIFVMELVQAWTKAVIGESSIQVEFFSWVQVGQAWGRTQALLEVTHSCVLCFCPHEGLVFFFQVG